MNSSGNSLQRKKIPSPLPSSRPSSSNRYGSASGKSASGKLPSF